MRHRVGKVAEASRVAIRLRADAGALYLACLVCALLLLAAWHPVQAATNRPRVGLVLGGGGARGAAHVGVLKVLEELHIPIDFIAGTSMGSIVGGLYASGMSPGQIEHELESIKWSEIFDDDPPRADQPWRRKRDDDSYLVKYKLGFGGGDVKFPLGAVQGQKFDLEIARLLSHVAGVTDFDRLRIPFRAVATDIATGEAVVLGRGDLARSIRASMAVPAAFGAVEIEGRLLVDGMVANNVPIDVARTMGADIVIVVDVGTPMMSGDEIKSMFGILNQLTNILSRRNVAMQLKTLKATDVLITPALGDFSASDFENAAKAIAIGRAAAEAARPRLATLGVAQSEYAAARADQRMPASSGPAVIRFLRLNNHSRIADEVILTKLAVPLDQPFDRRGLERGIADLYGLELFRSVRYKLVSEGDRQGLEVDVEERPWGPDYLKFGLALSSDFEGGSLWDIGASYRKTAVDGYGGEVLAGAQIGENPTVFFDVYQPLDRDLRWFLDPKIFYGSDNVSRFAGGHEMEEYRVHRYGGALAAGRELGRWGEIRAGVRRYAGNIDVRIGDPAIPDLKFDSAEAFAALSYDTLDNRNFPNEGTIAGVEVMHSVKALGADTNFSQLEASGAWVHTWSSLTAFGAFQLGYTADGTAAIQNRFRTGGFTRLSGFGDRELSGQQLVLLRMGAYQRISEISWMKAYLGTSLEYGNVYERRSDISLDPDSAILAGSVFLGVDLPIGPLYLGYGHAEAGRDRLFLFLGRLF